MSTGTGTRARREWFGAVVHSEHPGFTAFVDEAYADDLGLPRSEALPEGLFSAPLDVHLQLTTRCNLSCAGCYTRREGCEDRDLPLDLSKRILDHLATWGVFTVALGGGEPLLHPDVFEIAEHARARAVVPNITTNGLLIDERTARECRVFGNLHLSCHDASELPRLSRAAKALRENRITPGLNVLVSSATHPDLAQILAWARRERISQVLFLKFKLTAANRERRDLTLSEEQERDLLPLIRGLSRKFRVMPMLDCSLFPALALHRPKPRTLEFFDVTGCRGGNAYLAVDVDGRYKPCSFWEETFGDVVSLSPDDWVGSRELRAFREAPRSGACGGCDYLELCNGGCRLGGKAVCASGSGTRDTSS